MPVVTKLVRDNVPDLMRADGQDVQVRVATTQEMPQRFEVKMLEELAEAVENPCAEEYGDILQAMYERAALVGISPVDIETARIKKFERKGGYSKRLIASFTKE